MRTFLLLQSHKFLNIYCLNLINEGWKHFRYFSLIESKLAKCKTGALFLMTPTFFLRDVLTLDILLSKVQINILYKNAFQQDAYRPLVYCILESASGGGCVCLVQGGCVWSGGGLLPGGWCVWSGGGLLPEEGVCVWSGGWCLVQGGHPSMHWGRHPPLWTDTCL